MMPDETQQLPRINEAVSVIFVDTQIIDARAFAEIISLVKL